MKKDQSRRSQFSKAALKRAFNPPHDDTAEILHGELVKDPFRPFENFQSPETAAWVARENKNTDDEINTPESKAIQQEIINFFRGAVPRGRRESMAKKYGNIYVSQRKEETDKRYSYFVKDVPDYDAPARALLDPAKIDPSGKTTIGFPSFSPDGKKVAYALNVSGSDKATLKLMDIETGKDIDISYPNFQTNVNHTVQWAADSQGFFYYKYDPGTKSSAASYHKLGTPAAEDKLIYSPGEAEHGGALTIPSKDSTGEPGDFEYIQKYKAINVDETDKVALLYRKRGSDDAFKEIFPMKEGLLTPIEQVNGMLYAITNYKSPNSRLVSIDLNEPAPEKWQDVLPESATDPLKDVVAWQNKLFATYGQESGGQALKVFDLTGKYLHDAPIPDLSSFTLGQTKQDDPTALISYGNFKEDNSVYRYDSNANTLTQVKKSSAPIDLKDAIVELVHAPSKDGTLIPLTVIRGKDTKLDGTAATLLYGYGGFNISLEPNFSPSVAQWVKAGGIYVQAHVRGGGEKGQKWYDGGRLQNKQNVFDDMKAARDFLVKNKYTSTKRIAVQGGSNGGLMALVMAIQTGLKFGAFVAEVPVADMDRFHKGSEEGFSWKSDYGDPEVKKDFNTASKYAPIKNVKKGHKHAPLLIKTDINDDRVLPWHAFKAAATFQTREHPDSQTLLYVRTDGGHSAGMTEEQRFADIAFTRSFLIQKMGPINQDEFKVWEANKKKAATAAKKTRAPKPGKG